MSERWLKDGRVDTENLVPALQSFVGMVIRACRLELRADFHVGDAGADDIEGPEVLVNFQGRDSELLLERRGELLAAIEYLALRWLRLDPHFHDRVRFDCQNYKSNRVAELELAASTAAEQVRRTGAPFRFQPMEARERRILHLAVRDLEGVRTASEGDPSHRAVVVYPAPQNPTPRR